MRLSLLTSNLMLERSSRKTKFNLQLGKLNKTQSQLAKAVGVHKSSISRYKKGGDPDKGGRQPSLDTLRLLAKQGIDVLDLFGIESDQDAQLPNRDRKPNITDESSITDQFSDSQNLVGD